MKNKIEEHKPSQQSLSWKQRLWKNKTVGHIVKGVVVSLPIIITLFLISLLFKLILTILSPISKILDPASEHPHWTIHLLSLVVLIAFFYLVGKSISGRFSKFYLQKIEKKLLKKIPLYSTIKELVKQLSGFQKMPFSQVVLIDLYGSGVLMTGFVTEENIGDIYTVFVPTAPNPMNGNIYQVPAFRLRFVKVAPEAAMRSIVGMGTGSSCLFVPPDKDDKGDTKPGG